MNEVDSETVKEFTINDFLGIKLEKINNEYKINIYVADIKFRQCKYLLLNIPIEDVTLLNEINSVDEAANKLNHILHPLPNELIEIKIPPKLEFWGHCSNLQVWYENNYDTMVV